MDLTDFFYWNEYQTKIETKNLDNDNLTRFTLDAAFQGVRRLLVLAFNNTDGNANKVERNSRRKCFLPRVNITNYNVLKTATGQGDDYKTGCLLDYQFFKDHYNLIAVDFSIRKELGADSRVI